MDQLNFDTTAFPPAERFDRWRAGITDFQLEELDNTRPFDGCSIVTGLGALLISESTLPPLRFVRTPTMIKTSRRDHWTLTLAVDGVMHGDADGVPYRIAPGGLLLLNLARPAEVFTTRGRSMVIVLPHDLLGAGRPSEAHGPLPDNAEARLLATWLNCLSQALPGLQPSSALPASRALCELVAACLPPATDQHLRRLRRSHSLRARLLAHVTANLERNLDIADLCTALAVSRSALYRAVGDHGGVNGFVRTARLEAAHRALTDRTDRRGIQEIARSVGFRDGPQFSRHFHAAFGYTAAELRRTVTVPSALPEESGDAAIAFRKAIDRLATGPNAG
jgi:AraC-like DNA-binding protein